MKFGIDYRYLKAFQLTAHYLNFSKAAAELNIAQSAVSRQIKLLEESMDEQLIIRSSKKVILTDKGIALVKAISQFEEVTSELSSGQGHQLIRVGILHGLLENWFIKIIKEFSTTTDYELRIVTDTPKNLKQDLTDGKLDIIFTTENIQSDLITSLRLFEETLVLISKKDIDPKKADQYTWLTYSDSDFFYDLYKKHSSKIIEVKSITSIIKLVKEGVGIAIVPSHTIINEKVKTYDIKGLKRPQIHLSSLNFQSLPKYLKDFTEIVKSNA